MKKNKNKKNSQLRADGDNIFASLPAATRKWGGGIAMLVLAVLLVLGFFDMAGVAGRGLVLFLTFNVRWRS